MALHDLLEALQGDADPRARLAINRSIAYFLCYETEAAEEALLETFYPEAARVEVLLRQATTAAERISLFADFEKMISGKTNKMPGTSAINKSSIGG